MVPPTGEFLVLAVEDNQDHAALIQAAFARRQFPSVLRIMGSGEEAMDYLLGRGSFRDRIRHPSPDILILDLELPGMGGLDFLRWLNTRLEPWSRVPVIIFTSGASRNAEAEAYRLGAREIKIKPADFTELVDVVSRVLKRSVPNTA